MCSIVVGGGCHGERLDFYFPVVYFCFSNAMNNTQWNALLFRVYSAVKNVYDSNDSDEWVALTTVVSEECIYVVYVVYTFEKGLIGEPDRRGGETEINIT